MMKIFKIEYFLLLLLNIDWFLCINVSLTLLSKNLKRNNQNIQIRIAIKFNKCHCQLNNTSNKIVKFQEIVKYQLVCY